MNDERPKRKLAAILSADVKGYSRLMGDDELATVRTLEAYKALMAELIDKYRGRLVDSPGDNMLAEFASAVDAVEAGIEIQERLKVENSELPENRRMEFRIGINLGDVIEKEQSIYGDGVNVAARLEGLALGGGICISGKIYEEVKSKVSLRYEYLGKQMVKNISEAVPVYRVEMDAKSSVPDKRTAITLPEKPSVAVLPFTNRSGDPEQEYFSDGITERAPVDRGRATGSFFRRRGTWALIGLVAILFTGFFATHVVKLWKNTKSQIGEVSPVEQTEKQPTDSEITGIQVGSDELEEPSPVARKRERIDEYRAQAMAYLAEGKHRNAISVLEKILELDPGNEEAKKNIELAKKEVAKRVAVEESYRKGIESMDKGNYVEAVSSFAKVLELDPENKAARENMKLASKELRRTTVEENYYEGMDRMVKEDYLGAITLFEKVLEVDPGHQDAKHKIELAKKKLISRTLDKKDRKGIEPIPEEDRAAATTSQGVNQPRPKSNVLRLIYNQNCIGKTGPAELFIDERSYGVMTPGSEITVELSVGNHKVSLVDEEGNQWGPYTQTVQYGGGTRTFSCKPD